MFPPPLRPRHSGGPGVLVFIAARPPGYVPIRRCTAVSTEQTLHQTHLTSASGPSASSERPLAARASLPGRVHHHLSMGPAGRPLGLRKRCLGSRLTPECAPPAPEAVTANHQSSIQCPSKSIGLRCGIKKDKGVSAPRPRGAGIYHEYPIPAFGGCSQCANSQAP
jgi:hypothetical protein